MGYICLWDQVDREIDIFAIYWHFSEPQNQRGNIKIENFPILSNISRLFQSLCH